MVSTKNIDDPILLEIITEYNKSLKSTNDFVTFIQESANKAKLSFKTVGDGLISIFPKAKKEIQAAVAILETGVKNTERWRMEAEKLAASFEKVRFAQAQNKVKGLFTNEDFMSSIGSQAADERARFAKATEDAAKASAGLAGASSQAGGAVTKTTGAVGGASKALFSFTNLIRTAIGTLEAMAIFLLTRFIGEAIKKSIDSLKQFELAIYRIQIAERALSQAGVDITPQQLADIAKGVVETYKTVSEIDALKMVSNLAVLTKDLKLTADQYEKISQAIPLIAQQADISIESATDQIVQGLTKSGRGWADLGITVDAAIIKQRAVTDGLVESADAYNALTAEQKQQVEVMALINILYDNANTNLASQAEYLATVAGKQAKLNSSWETFTTDLGILSSPALKAGLDILDKFVNIMIKDIERVRGLYIVFMAETVAVFQTVKGVLDGNITSLSALKDTFLSTLHAAASALDQYMKPQVTGDTPTSPTGVNDAVVSETEDLQKALEKMNNAILDAQIKLGQDMEEAAIDLGRKLVDIAEEYAKKRADAERDYGNKVRDINLSYNNKIQDINQSQAEAQQKARNDEIDREQEFQNKMLELKEKYLMDLEDALHERDARAVLRLMKQYNLSREQAERDHALEEDKAGRDLQTQKQKFASERKQAELDRRQKLEAARQDYLDKLEQLKRDEEAERHAAEVAYARKVEDLQREMENRLAIVGASLVQEFNLTKQGLDAIFKLYMTYYTNISKIYSAMNQMLAGQGAISATTLANRTYTAPSSGGGGRSSSIKAFAEGGSMIANSPTTVTFGENGIELATFTPIGRNGRDTNKLFSSLSGNSGEGMSGQVALDVFLSPDLEARVVDKATTQTANVITRIQKSKVR